jgi:hypothetical protein
MAGASVGRRHSKYAWIRTLGAAGDDRAIIYWLFAEWHSLCEMWFAEKLPKVDFEQG